MRKKMEYKIISGRTVEIRRSWMTADPSQRRPRGTRRAGASSLKKILANERETVLKLGRIINCNFSGADGDAFVTCKYTAEMRPGSYEDARKIFGRFLDRLRREYRRKTGKALAAVWVTANWSPKGDHAAAAHHHAVMPSEAVELVRKLWPRYGGIGTVGISDLRDQGDFTSVAAYMLANVRGRPANERKWSCCRGMERPIYTEPVEVSDIEGVQPLPGSVIEDVGRSEDEEGNVIGSYLRCRLDRPPKVRGGQIVFERRGRRRGG
ncbi:MAG: hypothetical protein IJ713_01270 [Oscillibacter sp.]|nr:hypothetical protein [Oscillibacter sp.]